MIFLFEFIYDFIMLNGILFDIYIFNNMKPVKCDEAYQCTKNKIKYAIQEVHYRCFKRTF